MTNHNGGIVPPWLQFPITLPIMPPGWQEPAPMPNWLVRDLGYEGTHATSQAQAGWRLFH